MLGLVEINWKERDVSVMYNRIGKSVARYVQEIQRLQAEVERLKERDNEQVKRVAMFKREALRLQAEAERLTKRVTELEGFNIGLANESHSAKQRADGFAKNIAEMSALIASEQKRADELLDRLGKTEAKLASVALTGSPFDEEALAKRDKEQQIKALESLLNSESGYLQTEEGQFAFYNYEIESRIQQLKSQGE